MPDDHGAHAGPKSDFGRSELNEALLETMFLFGGNAGYIEELAARYAEDPNSVDPSWRAFFEELGDSGEVATRAERGPAWKRADWPPSNVDEMITALTGETPREAKAPQKAPDGKTPGARPAIAPPKTNGAAGEVHAAPSDAAVRRTTLDSIRALMMIRAYRIRGHLAANLDPLHIASFGEQPELDPETYGFGPEDLDRPIFIDGVLGLETATVRQMLDILKRTYCSTLGVEFMHITSPEEKAWLQERIEGPDKGVSFTAEGKKAILKKLIETETFEQFLHKRYPGTKRFGIDGGEAMVPALEQIIKRGGALGVDEIVIGMPHRGRLNVLAAVMGKPYHAIFNEFKGADTNGKNGYGSGDVKYHLGASSDREFDGN
ncbi:MAG: 2-oxoglutarate dehydrogenase E1 component, partial [Maricaulaceae bacterium]